MCYICFQNCLLSYYISLFKWWSFLKLFSRIFKQCTEKQHKRYRSKRIPLSSPRCRRTLLFWKITYTSSFFEFGVPSYVFTYYYYCMILFHVLFENLFEWFFGEWVSWKQNMRRVFPWFDCMFSFFNTVPLSFTPQQWDLK